jgi:group I intron endonuclease
MYTDYLYALGYNNPYPSGVYCVLCVPTFRLYVGSTKNLTHRAAQHFRSLEEGTHHNRELQYHFDAHGASSFSFVVLEYVPDLDRLGEAEQRWLNRLLPRAFNHQHRIKRPDDGEWLPVDCQPLPWEEE